MNLRNRKNIIITGANGQVGLEIFELLNVDFNIIPIVRSTQQNQSKSSYFICEDLSNKNECEKTFNKIFEVYPKIDALINIAGGFDIGKPIESQDWEKMFKINFQTMLNATSCTLKNMKDNNGGKIINFGSVAGIDGMGMAGPYSASKAAVHNLSKTINLESPPSVSSYVLVLSIINTKINREAMPNSKFSEWISIKSISEKISSIVNNEESDDLIYFD